MQNYSTIFKILDGENGFLSKIGVFKKSFADIGKAFADAFDETLDFDEGIFGNQIKNQGFLKNLKNNLMPQAKDVAGLYSKLFVTSKDIQPFKKDISLYEKDSKQIFNDLIKRKKLIDSDKSSWQEYFDTLGKGEKWQEEFVNQNDMSKISLDAVDKAQKAAKETAITYNKGLEQMTIGAKAADLALKGLALAGNLALSYLGSMALSYAIKKYKEFFPTVEETRKALEKSSTELEEQTKKVDDLSKSLEEAEKNLKELQDAKNIQFITDEELQKQQEYTEELRTQLAIEKERQAIAAKETLKDAKKAYTNYKEKYDQNGEDLNNGTYAGNENFAQKSSDIVGELENTIKAYKIQEQEYDRITNELAELEGKTDKASVNKFNSLSKQQDNISKKMTDIRETALGLHDDIENVANAYDDIKASGEVLSDTEYGIWSRANDGVKLYNKFLEESTQDTQKNIDLQEKKLEAAKKNLEDEYKKISDWELDDYSDQIKNGTIQSKFGNVDMDKRTIIHWSDELKKTYADALASWDYDPEVGSIDTVFGGSERFGEELNGEGWEVAFTPILPDGTFLSKDTVEKYINSILEEAYADDSKVTEDELTAIDAQGRKVGNTFVQGIFAGIDDSQNYDNNGNWADVVGRLMHFSGDFGAIELAKQQIKDLGGKIDEVSEKKFNIADETTSKSIDDFQKKISTLSTAIQNLKDRKLSGSDLIDLQQEFPQLIGQADNLDTALKELVDGSLKDLTTSLQDSNAPASLIQSLQELANQAKGLSSADWLGTFDVFDKADSQMQTLAEFTKALGKNYTITAAEARKFAAVYPELLQLGQVTSNGLIKYNKEVVDNFVNGKQTQIDADRETQISQLETEKALLEGKRSAAQAALELVVAQKTGEIDGENQADEKIAEARDNLVQHLMDLGVDEQNADAAAKELMAGNTQEYDRVVAEVSNNIDSNLTNSINDASANVNTQSKNMIQSLFGVAKQAFETGKAILGIGKENASAPVEQSIDGIKDSIKNFTESDAVADFKKSIGEAISVDRYQGVDPSVKLQLDIDNYTSAIGEIDSQINLLKSAGNKSLQDYVKDLDKSGKSKDGKGDKENSTIDWIARKAELLERESKRLETALSDTWTAYTGLSDEDIKRVKELFNMDISPDSEGADELLDYADKLGISIGELQELAKNNDLESRQSILSQIIDNDERSLEQQQEALDQYTNSYETLLSKVPEYRDLIENGGDEVETLTGDKKTLVDNAKETYDKILDTEEKVQETEKKLRSDKTEYYDNIIDKATAENDNLSATNDLLQGQIDLLNTEGQIISSGMYEDLIDNLKQQADIAQQILDTKVNKLADEMAHGLKVDDPEWYTLTNEIIEARKNVNGLNKELKQQQKELRELPVTNLEKLGNIYQNILDTIQNWGSEMEASGKKLDANYYQKLIDSADESISNYKKEIEAIQDVMEDYDPGTDNWNEMNDKLQQCNSSISSLVQNMHKWNEELLNLPIERITDASDSLSKIVDGLNDVKSEHETVISAVTGAISAEIDRLNDEKEAYEDTINDQKEALQDRMDLLDKQNEKLKLQAQYEQALYDLENATTQKTEKVKLLPSFTVM